MQMEGRPRSRRKLQGSRNPLVAIAIALPVAALLAFAFGGWSQFAVQATSVVHLVGR
ncbi:hypothetical protein [Streptacidiphilus sp. P02-A3a]|uniref:hypothetical protein n=1 Tax=Streptacidiphilus sp. P02-A3a TaxID=2704468 RepID=UPI0015F8F0AA|nr:hypothetical protein [Streptacidiphilus sp. P02-A3a]QMU66814.1 hypothetical protein GXP74_13915 [Streptacidiphilus sp. P02-A3a]